MLDRIARTLRERGDDALLAHDVKDAAKTRVYGFEILPAPFVISHLQIGMLLHGLGTPLSDEADERAGVYLTNALTGWEPPTEPKQHLLFTEMEEERDKAQTVKQHAPILVILGNPPYNGFAGAAIDEERDLVTAYRTVKNVTVPRGQGLNDLYVRFFRMAERRISEGTEGRGVVCFISNYSWLDGLSCTGMRESYLRVFDKIWIDCLNGDKYRTGKLAPDGSPDPSVFSTEHNREGIQVGTAVSLLMKRTRDDGVGAIRYREYWGMQKLHQLQDWGGEAGYEAIEPGLGTGLSFRPTSMVVGYVSWPRLPQLFPLSVSGVQTNRDTLVVDIDRSAVEERMARYFSREVSHEDVARECSKAMQDTARFDARATRERLLSRGLLLDRFRRYCYRPLDYRWVYWEPEGRLLGEKSPDFYPLALAGTELLVTTGRTRGAKIVPPIVTKRLTDLNAMDSGSRATPLWLAEGESELQLAARESEPRANLSAASWDYLNAVKAEAPELFWHAVAILYAPEYRSENASGIHHDWPRIPLPARCRILRDSAKLGRHLAALVDAEDMVDGVSTGSMRNELRPVGSLASVSGGQLDPSVGDLAITAGWGHAGQSGATMPGRGRAVERPYSKTELAAFREGLKDLGLTYDQLMACLGGACCDVYLNERAYWRCVPARVWTYTIGGYQVMKKWLSYRERSLLGRDLRPEEARYVTEMARRIAAILLLEPALDENYERVKADIFTWPLAQ